MVALVPLWTYTRISVSGWDVRVEAALERSPQWVPARDELTRQLRTIVDVVPKGPLARLQEVTIWMRLDDPSTPCAAYHPGADWLRQHETDPAMAKGVEITNAANFVSWSHIDQPWMVLHELSHAYHDQVLGFDDVRIQTAYSQAMRLGIYERVYKRSTPAGKTVRHYACTNPQEFFAETTEAYFGTNDFYPFNRAELKAFDPASYRLMRMIWEPAESR